MNSGFITKWQFLCVIILWIIDLSTSSFSQVAPKESAQEVSKCIDSNSLSLDPERIKLSGYVDFGYSYNFTGSSGGATDYSSVNGRISTDTAQRGDFNLYAVKFALEKELTSENRFQAGFRFDILIGEDASFFANRSGGSLNNTDSNSNSLFTEQAFTTFRIPVGNGLDLKFGKTEAFLGLEGMDRPTNPCVTFGLLFNVMPIWFIGMVSNYTFDPLLEATFCIVNGINTDNNVTTSSGTSDGVGFGGGLVVTAPSGNANWKNYLFYGTSLFSDSYISSNNATLTTSQATLPPEGEASGFPILYNSNGSWAPLCFENRLYFGVNALLGNIQGSVSLPGVNGVLNDCWYGAGLYAKYYFNDFLSLQGRGEFLGSNTAGIFGNQGTAFSSSPTGHLTGNNIWESTLTANFNLTADCLIRAEYRMDWGSNIYSTKTGNHNGSVSGGPAYYAGAEVVCSF